jgi:CubicO group peptidase (beta-lactamase class C family)
MLNPTFMAAEPEEVGIDRERLQALFARVKRDVDGGVLPSAQVAVARRGKLAGMRTFGTVLHGSLETPATDRTLYCIFSSTKGAVAAAIWALMEDGRLRVHERVAAIVPEFGTNGKEGITVEQLLLHVSGFPYAPFHPDHWGDRAKLVEAFARWRLNWEPGARFEYHPTSAHWVLAEIIERRSGQDYRAFIRDRILVPMGLEEFFIGLPPEHDARVADIRYVGEIVEPPGGWRDVTPDAILALNEPRLRRAGLPGGGGIASAAELALFYQALVNGGRTATGISILKPETIGEATRVRSEAHHLDPLLNIPVNRALGVVVAGNDGNAHLRGFGKVASPFTFGHGGAGGQIAWGDPETGISVGYCTNGFVDWMTAGRRTTAVSSLAAACAA